MTLTRWWFVLAALTAAPLFVGGLGPECVGSALACFGILLAATIADYRLAPDRTALTAARSVEPQLSLGAENPVRVELRVESRWSWRVLVRDEPPEEMPHDFEDVRLRLHPGVRHTLTYHVTPRARGDFEFGDIWLRISGRMGLVECVRRVPAAQAVKVYPNLIETAKFTLMARRGRLQQVGIRAARLMGAGREFESLRDYQSDDEYRRIDWKATARRGKLTSRQYEVERSQNIVLAIDVGRTMLAEIDGIAKMDYAVNAALLLAYVATLTDDRVGLLVFADTVQTWLPPAKGRAQVYRILEALYNVEARRAEPDYRQAFAYLRSRWRRRSLIVCFTDLWDPDSSRQTMTELQLLQPHHLAACVTLLDTKVLRLASAPVVVAADAYSQAVARQVLDDRNRAMAELAHRGVLVVDTPADQLSAALVNRYLEVKERMLL